MWLPTLSGKVDRGTADLGELLAEKVYGGWGFIWGRGGARLCPGNVSCVSCNFFGGEEEYELVAAVDVVSVSFVRFLKKSVGLCGAEG